jgi:hypothetical protein
MNLMNVYRFLPAKWAKVALVEKRLKCSLLNELNDPFELLAYSFKTHSERRAIDLVKQKLGQTTALLCCSKSWSNPVLWSHYAEDHKGICLEFDVLDERICREVKYITDRIPFDGVMSPDVALNILYSKFHHWEYEDEVRLGTGMNEKENGKVFIAFGQMLKATKVILGERCSESVAEITQLARDHGHELDVVKARLSLQEFAIEAETQEHRDYDQYLASINPLLEYSTRIIPKVGRNEPCPCGSTLKYKNCHGR